jgi:hypothetical protein
MIMGAQVRVRLPCGETEFSRAPFKKESTADKAID